MPQHLLPLLQQAKIDKTIVVQTQHQLAENAWALKLAEQHDWIAGVVGWVDLASPTCEEQLLQFKDHPKFVGVRHVTQDEPDDDFIVRPDILRGLKILEKEGVPFDLLFYVKHLRHVPRLVQELPNLPLVIDHLAKPAIKQQRLDDWLPDFVAAAKFPNVYCKLSGLITEADWGTWQPADLHPYIEQALEAFGPQRLMFGSDWPVCELAGSYARVVQTIDDELASLSVTDRDWIMGRTAAKFYEIM